MSGDYNPGNPDGCGRDGMVKLEYDRSMKLPTPNVYTGLTPIASTATPPPEFKYTPLTPPGGTVFDRPTEPARSQQNGLPTPFPTSPASRSCNDGSNAIRYSYQSSDEDTFLYLVLCGTTAGVVCVLLVANAYLPRQLGYAAGILGKVYESALFAIVGAGRFIFDLIRHQLDDNMPAASPAIALSALCACIIGLILLWGKAAFVVAKKFDEKGKDGRYGLFLVMFGPLFLPSSIFIAWIMVLEVSMVGNMLYHWVASLK